jgi:hypothetical protein
MKQTSKGRSTLFLGTSGKRKNQVANSLKNGWRSGLEEKIADELAAQKVAFSFESLSIEYIRPAKKCRYTPDFILPNGIIVETKGRFVTADRQKHLLIKEQHPELDIRFVFNYSKSRISKKSSTTYAMWCEKHGFQYADKSIPANWLKEKKKR